MPARWIAVAPSSRAPEPAAGATATDLGAFVFVKRLAWSS
jgi:hypothetical protein